MEYALHVGGGSSNFLNIIYPILTKKKIKNLTYMMLFSCSLLGCLKIYPCLPGIRGTSLSWSSLFLGMVSAIEEKRSS